MLAGTHVTLRPLMADDWDALFTIAADPLLWEQHPAKDRWQEPVFRAFFDEAMASRGAFATIERASGALIGTTRFANHDPAAREIEIGWSFVARRCWGGAYNREAKRLMIDHAFSFVDTVVFVIGEGNGRSRAAIERVGARLRPGTVPRDPAAGPGRNVVYEIRREDWA